MSERVLLVPIFYSIYCGYQKTIGRHRFHERDDRILRAGLWKVRCISCNHPWRSGPARENCKAMGKAEQRPHLARTYQLRRVPRQRDKNCVLPKPLQHSPMRLKKRGIDLRRLPGFQKLPIHRGNHRKSSICFGKFKKIGQKLWRQLILLRLFLYLFFGVSACNQTDR